jgi:hypothetical protein
LIRTDGIDGNKELTEIQLGIKFDY